MGPGFAIIVLMFATIATVVVGSLLLMRSWRASLLLFAAYAALLIYISLTPQLVDGQMNRAALGLGWLALILAGIVQALLLIKRRSSR